MARDILSEYGRNTPKTQRSGAECGGVLPDDVKPIPYKEPVGPKGISDPKSPGLHGTNHGCFPGQGRH